MSRSSHDPRRRALLGAGVALAAVPLSAVWLPAAATGGGGPKLVVILLRGAMDGLAAVPPHGDSSYRGARGGIALDPADILDLDGFFGLHRALRPLHSLYRNDQLLILHASAGPYRARSHFRAQDILELGTFPARVGLGGWLNRAITASAGADLSAVAVGSSLPLILQGPARAGSWSPARTGAPGADFYQRVLAMYPHDDPLGQALAEGLATARIAPTNGGGRGPKQLAADAARLMRGPQGADITVIEMIGWDTHRNQGTGSGRLAGRLTQLGEAIDALHTGLGGQWRQSAVIALTEFGRTVHANGTGGTDHGTAGAALVAGGAIAGGRVIGDWPGLARDRLYQQRDLYPANDLRGLLKGLLAEHLRIDPERIEESVFPDSTDAVPIRGLVRG